MLDLLFDAARNAQPIQGSRHSSVLLFKKQVLSVGVNSLKSHPLQKKFGGEKKIFLHSEMSAIVQAINQHGSDVLQKCELYNLRLTKAGNVGLAKPCAACQRAIDAFKIRKVYWTYD